jgi:CRP-like cAMP-binding protein
MSMGRFRVHPDIALSKGGAVERTGNFLRGRRAEQIGAAERAALEAVLLPSEEIEGRTLVVRAGERVTRSILLIDGFMCRYMDDRRGQRQLVAVHVPGDFVDLHGFPLQRLDHDIATVTRATVAYADHAALTAVTEELPHLGRMLWFSTLLDAAMHREWIFRLGRLDAVGRIAHFLAETNCRLSVIGQSDGHSFTLPLTQADVAEACGLSPIHVSRTLAQLRTEGVVDVQGGVVRIHDRDALFRLGEFEPGYLYLDDDFRVP